VADRDLIVNDQITIPESELELRFSRSSGAGGQNVNKVNSRAELRYQLMASTVLPAGVKTRLIALAGNRITSEGVMLFSSQRHRDQPRNIDDCYGKLKALIEQALRPPRPRRPNRTPPGVHRRRLTNKKRRAEVKRNRGAVDPD